MTSARAVSAGMLAVVLAVLLAPTQSSATDAAPSPEPIAQRDDDPGGQVDRATRCLRGGDDACALRSADAALATLGLQEAAADVPLRAEALILRARALARLDRADEAVDAFVLALQGWPGWQPPPGSDPRVIRAHIQAQERAQEQAQERRHPKPKPASPSDLPTTIPLGPPPQPPQRPLNETLIPPLMVEPPGGDGASTPSAVFSISLGGGVALTTGASADRYDPGLQAALEFGWRMLPSWDLWVEATMTLLSISDTVRAEPGYSSGLSRYAVVLGTRWNFPVAQRFELVLAGGVGWGGFGLRDATDVQGIALTAVGGIRFFADPHLAFRFDITPTMVVPLVIAAPSPEGANVGVGGHISFILRGEVVF